MRPVCIFFLLLFSAVCACAQDDDFESALDYKINRMQTQLHLTDAQAIAVRPIVKRYLMQRQEVLKEVAGEGIVDHVAVGRTLKELKNKEYEGLSKILSADQMQKLIDKDHLTAALNPDNPQTSVDEDSGMTMEGASLKF